MSKKFQERNTCLTNQFNDFPKNQTQQPQRALFREIEASIQIPQKAKTEETSEAVIEVIIADTKALTVEISTDLRFKIKTLTCLDNSHINLSNSKIQIHFFQPQFPPQNQNFQNQKSKIQIVSHSLHLKFVLLILNICLKQSKLKLLATNVVILTTWRRIAQYEELLRVVEHKTHSIKIQITNYIAQESKTQTCEETRVKKARHML